MLSLGIFASLAALATAVPSADTTKVCDALFEKYPRYLAYDTLGPEAPKTAANASVYTDINTVYWNNQNSYQHQAACAFFPGNAQQVSEAVKLLNRYPSVKFALKSGGHQPAPGFSAVKDGVIISFEPNMASAERTPNGKHFILGPGARWGDVYNVTGRTNQIVVGGRLAHIGVGGLTLGGGLSYYSAQYGLACDNVDQWEAVLANGTVVTANRHSHPDLWWALRGGGNQFAIVTRIWTQAHPAGVNGQIWGGERAYSIDKREAYFRAITRFVRDYPDAKAAIIPTFQFAFPGNNLTAETGLSLFMFYDAPTPPPGIFKDFDDIDELSSTTETRNYFSMSQESAGGAIVGLGNSFREMTYPNLPEDDMVDFLGKYWDGLDRETSTDGLDDLGAQVTGFNPQPVSVRVAKASRRQGGNTLGLDPRHGDRVWMENNWLWSSPLCNSKCPQRSRAFSNKLMAYQKQKYAGVPPTNYKFGNLNHVNYNPLFMNDAAPDQDVYSSYGSANLRRLQAIKKAYDPTGFLSTRQGGFKLPA